MDIKEVALKIFFVIKSLALHGGGAERILAVVTNGLIARGHDITVVTLDESKQKDFYTLDTRIHRISLAIGNTVARSGLASTFRRTTSLRKLILQHRPDAVVGFMHSAYVPLGIGLIGTGIPVIGSEHIVYFHFKDRPIERLSLKLVSPFLHSNTAITLDMIAGFPGSVRRKMTLVPNPVGNPPSILANTNGGFRKTLLSVGRLEPQKDHQTLIAAFAQIADRHPEWDLRIVGEGVLRSDLERQVQDAGLGTRVALPGATANIDSEYLQAQLFVMPSRYESFGLATAEAMAHGLPAVGFDDCPGTNELIVDGENGALVKGQDRVTALAQALSRLMQSAEERRRLAAAAPVRVAPFATDVVVDRWERLILAAVAGKQPPRDIY